MRVAPTAILVKPMTNFDLSYRLLASRFIRRQVRQLAEQLDGIRQGEDPECIHRAWVGSRRLRAAMRHVR